MQICDIMSHESHTPYTFLGDADSIVGGVVQDLNLQLVGGILDGTGSFDDPLDDVSFVEDGKLDGYGGQFVKMTGRLGVLAVVAVVNKDEKIAVKSVKYQGRQEQDIDTHKELVE